MPNIVILTTSVVSFLAASAGAGADHISNYKTLQTSLLYFLEVL